ncbi:MAG TPA: hypothetical protein PKY87_14600 [Terricaulis sp.]|nr:hypothetical protein [Terricaulis sp.]
MVSTAPMQRPPEIPEPEEARPFFQIPFAEACAMKALASKGAERGFVRAPDVGPAMLRALRGLDLIEIADGARGMEVMFNDRGKRAMPSALRIIAAGPAAGGRR